MLFKWRYALIERQDWRIGDPITGVRRQINDSGVARALPSSPSFLPPSLSLLHTHTHTHIHAYTHTHTHIHTHTRTHTYAHIQIHTHIHIHTHTHIHTLIHSHTHVKKGSLRVG